MRDESLMPFCCGRRSISYFKRARRFNTSFRVFLLTIIFTASRFMPLSTARHSLRRNKKMLQPESNGKCKPTPPPATPREYRTSAVAIVVELSFFINQLNIHSLISIAPWPVLPPPLHAYSFWEARWKNGSAIPCFAVSSCGRTPPTVHNAFKTEAILVVDFCVFFFSFPFRRICETERPPTDRPTDLEPRTYPKMIGFTDCVPKRSRRCRRNQRKAVAAA